MTPTTSSKHGTGWFATPNMMIDEYAGVIGPTAYLVYSTLRRFADKTGACWPSITTLAKLTGLTRRAVQMNLKRLVDAGMVKVESSRGGRGKQATNRYVLLSLTTHAKDESGFTLGKVSANVGAPLGVNLGAPLGVNLGAPKEDYMKKTIGQRPVIEAAAPTTGHDDANGDCLLKEGELLQAWNAADGCCHARGSALTNQRRTAFRARLKEDRWFTDAMAAIAKFPLPVTMGDPTGWKPDLDWFLKPGKAGAILEGKYDWSKTNGHNNGRCPTGPGQRFDPGAEKQDTTVGQWK